MRWLIEYLPPYRVATQLLSARKLKKKKKWSELIQLYNGNPLWLNIIASTILDLFNGSVQEFLSYPTLFLGDLEPILKQHYQRLLIFFHLTNRLSFLLYLSP